MRSALACSPLVLVCAAVVASGCGSTETSSGGGSSSSGPPTLTITGPAPGACVEVPLDRAVGVPITFSVSGVVLRPPGNCGQLDVCGHVLLYVGDNLNNAGSNPVIDVLSMPDAPIQGPFDLTLRLVTDTGADMLGASGSPVTASLSLVAQPSCGSTTSGSGGAGGGSTTGSGGTGGGTTTTGSGGTGGTTTTGSGGTGGTGGSTTTTGSGGTGGGLTTTGSGGTTNAGAGGSTSTGT